jgi:tRNA threonylcarbamoyladenosine biosynthesis protein TsaB
MIKILAIDTSTAACSVALAVGGEICQRHVLAPRQHAQLILPWVESLLAEASLTLGQLDAIAVGRGPGGFTGIRIGVGVAQGLALGADLPIVPVSSLQIIAQTALANFDCKEVLVAQDARMNEVYWAAYQVDDIGIMRAQIDDQLCLPSEVELPAADIAWTPVGDAWQNYRPALAAKLHEISLETERDVYPESQHLARLAALFFTQGSSLAAELAQPIYLRGKEAWRPQ